MRRRHLLRAGGALSRTLALTLALTLARTRPNPSPNPTRSRAASRAVSPLYLPHISPISRPYLPYISLYLRPEWRAALCPLRVHAASVHGGARDPNPTPSPNPIPNRKPHPHPNPYPLHTPKQVARATDPVKNPQFKVTIDTNRTPPPLSHLFEVYLPYISPISRTSSRTCSAREP